MANYDYDMLVIGSGPAGQRAAIRAAKLEKRVAVVERKETVGGVAVNVDHSQQDAPGGSAVPFRVPGAGAVW